MLFDQFCAALVAAGLKPLIFNPIEGEAETVIDRTPGLANDLFAEIMSDIVGSDCLNTVYLGLRGREYGEAVAVWIFGHVGEDKVVGWRILCSGPPSVAEPLAARSDPKMTRLERTIDGAWRSIEQRLQGGYTVVELHPSAPVAIAMALLPPQ